MNTPAIPLPDTVSIEHARNRQAQLTKPRGALGQLETLAIQLAGLQCREQPSIAHRHLVIFAADHGVAREGVSAFPQSVTVAMIRNFAHGGAAMSVLARRLMAALEIVDLGTATPYETLSAVTKIDIAPGTANFVETSAMTPEQCERARAAGHDAAQRAAAAKANLFIAGEMGIANTTSAAALACSLLDAPARELAGPGTGLDNAGVNHKIAVIERGLTLHGRHPDQPETALQQVGGLEIAAMTQAYLTAASLRIPSLVDGFISSVAALTAVRIAPALRPWLLFAHRSAEPGHRRILAELAAEPLLDLGMRLGEGSAAALAVPILEAACALHSDMATFSEAKVAGPSSS